MHPYKRIWRDGERRGLHTRDEGARRFAPGNKQQKKKKKMCLSPKVRFGQLSNRASDHRHPLLPRSQRKWEKEKELQ
jgi:hypothetical protein